jgi:hypothetical protein
MKTALIFQHPNMPSQLCTALEPKDIASSPHLPIPDDGLVCVVLADATVMVIDEVYLVYDPIQIRDIAVMAEEYLRFKSEEDVFVMYARIRRN